MISPDPLLLKRAYDLIVVQCARIKQATGKRLPHGTMRSIELKTLQLLQLPPQTKLCHRTINRRMKKLTLLNPPQSNITPSNPPPTMDSTQVVVPLIVPSNESVVPLIVPSSEVVVPLIVPSSMSLTSTFTSSSYPIDIHAKYPELVYELPAIEERLPFPGRLLYQLHQSIAATHNAYVFTTSMRPLVSKLYHFLRNIFDSGARYGHSTSHPPIQYVCGPPGTGKTSSVKNMINIAMKNSGRTINDKPDNVVFINCTTLPGYRTGRNLSLILKKLGKVHKDTMFLRRKNIKAEDAVTLLILDEIDVLIGLAGTESMLKELLRMATSEDYTLAIIGISNSIHNPKTDAMKNLGMEPVWNNIIIFPAYSTTDFEEMIKYTTGFSVLTSKTTSYIAARISASSGDARLFFEQCRKTLKQCIERLCSNKSTLLIGNESSFKTTIHDALLAFRVNGTNFKELILALPSLQRHILCCGAFMSKHLKGMPVSTRQLKTTIFQAYGHEVGDDLTLDDFRICIENLICTGLLKVQFNDELAPKTTIIGRPKKKDYFVRPTNPIGTNASLLRSTMTFQNQVEDVELALGSTLMDDKLYSDLFARFKNRIAKK